MQFQEVTHSVATLKTSLKPAWSCDYSCFLLCFDLFAEADCKCNIIITNKGNPIKINQNYPALQRACLCGYFRLKLGAGAILS